MSSSTPSRLFNRLNASSRTQTLAERKRVAKRKSERLSVLPGQHIVLHSPSDGAQRVAQHTDPIRELLGEPAPGQSALDKKLALARIASS